MKRGGRRASPKPGAARTGAVTPEPTRAATWLALGAILVAAVWLYVPALRTDFFADDYLFLDQVRGRPLLTALLIPDPLSNFFRPVSRQLYFWIIAGLTNESPVAFRIGNLLTFLAALVLLFAIGRRLAGARAGIIAAGILALHYVPDVPVRWACGSQELLAVVGALGAILLHLQGRRVLAGVAMVLAALSKEVVLLTPLIAIVADRRRGEPWLVAARRAWPLLAAVLVWGIVFVSMPHRRAAQGTEVEFDLVNSPLAAFAHLIQVVLGAEWRHGEFGRLPKVWPPLVPLALVAAAFALAWRFVRARGESPDAAHALRTGLIWALVATLPVAAVAILWSAYYYLFAICGVAIGLGAWLARRNPAWAYAALLVLASGSASARWLDEFSVERNAWTAQSHINQQYIGRSNRIVREYLASLQRRHPEFPTGSTLFFAGLRGNVAFQRGDGPLVRWAYRDSSLRSYYLNAFSREKVGRGPLYVFFASADTLRQVEPVPNLFYQLAVGMLVSDHPESAGDALALEAERGAEKRGAVYALAWTEWAAGDTARAADWLARSGATLERGSAPERTPALAQIAAGDTAGALQVMREAVRKHPFDAGAHALLADLLLVHDRRDPDAVIEAFAARVLAPQDPYAWRRWAMIQTDRERYLEALGSFEQYFKVGGDLVAADTEAHGWAAKIRAALPGGDLAPEALRE